MIDEQIRTLGSIIHVYGHQHRNRRRRYGDVLYVSACLGYREERVDRVIGDFGIPAPIWPTEAA